MTGYPGRTGPQPAQRAIVGGDAGTVGPVAPAHDALQPAPRTAASAGPLEPPPDVDLDAAEERLGERVGSEQLKDEFISVVSHELRTPLTSIHGSLGLIAGGLGGALTPRARQLLDVALRNSQRLLRLVDDILDLQKIESGTMLFDLRLVEIGPLLEHAIEANQAYASQLGVAYLLKEVPWGARVRADPDRLMQVLTNLLSNAARFSPPEEVVSVSASRAAGRVCVEVGDRGPGIPEEFRPRVFQKFAQARTSSAREQGGTGLGLSISKAIIERLGGRIGFETELGVGTTFRFELPEWSDGGVKAGRRKCEWRQNA
jgi:signal transduction histidine kinase